MLHIGYRVWAEREPIFLVYGSSPVVAHGESDSWNETYTDPGAVFVHDSTFYMFYNGFNGLPDNSLEVMCNVTGTGSSSN